MAMKLTKYQQEMLDGKHGEAKKSCMEKLTDFGEAVEATEMVDLVLVLNACPIWSKDRRDPKTARKLAEYAVRTVAAAQLDILEAVRGRLSVAQPRQ